MNCKAIYDTDTLWEMCSKKTYKAYTEFKLDQLIQREKSLFQETLVEIENDRTQKRLAKYREIDMTLMYKAQDYLYSFQMAILDVAKIDMNIAENMVSQIGLTFDYVKKLRPIRLSESRTEIRKIINQVAVTDEEKVEEMKKNTFIKNCSVSSCKGTLNNRWCCRLCETPHCSKCGEKKEKKEEEEVVVVEQDGEKKGEEENDGHVCDPNMVQTLEEIKKNSKPCPKCGVAIFKTEGCDQMFCIICHTAFSWKTREIETGRIHNPHYYEMLRATGQNRREEGDVRPCDEIVQWHSSPFKVYEAIVTRQKVAKVVEVFRFVQELEAMYNERTNRITNQTFLPLRKKYLLNEISGEQFRTRIKTRNTKVTKEFERCQVLSVTKISMSEELKRLMRYENGELINERGFPDFADPEYFFTKYNAFESNINLIIENSNKMLEKIGRKYPTLPSKIILRRDRYVVSNRDEEPAAAAARG
jgi:predicted transcriptional regulator